MPDPVPQEMQGTIGRVGPEGNAPVFEKGFHFGPPALDQGPDHHSPANGRNSRKPPGPRTPEEAHNHRFGLVIGRMPQGNLRGFLFFGCVQEEGVSCLAGCLLEGEMLPLLPFPDIHPAADERNPQAGGGFADEHFFFFGLRPEAVVQVGDHQGKGQFSLDFP